MFLYSEGYEIDGSDTSYNLLIPEQEKCLEVLNFFLSLKTVDRDVPFVSAKKEYRFDQRQEMLEELIKKASFEIHYRNVEPNKAYPEIKREMLELLAKDAKIDLSKFNNPVISDTYSLGGFIFVAKKASNSIEVWESASSKIYTNAILKSKFFCIEFECAMGCPFAIYLYNLNKLKERFPELEINVKDTAKYIDDCLAGNNILERIKLEVNEPIMTLESFVAQDNVYFYVRRAYPKKPLLSKTHLMPDVLRYNHGNKVDESRYFEYEGFKDNNKGFLPEPHYDILSGIAPNSEMTIDEYAEYLRKLKDVNYKGIDFSEHSSFCICIKYEDKTILCKIRFVWKLNKLIMFLDVEHEYYTYVRNLLNIRT